MARDFRGHVEDENGREVSAIKQTNGVWHLGEWGPWYVYWLWWWDGGISDYEDVQGANQLPKAGTCENDREANKERPVVESGRVEQTSGSVYKQFQGKYEVAEATALEAIYRDHRSKEEATK